MTTDRPSSSESVCVLFSAGIDSTVLLYKAKAERDRVATLTFRYGQAAIGQESERAARIAHDLEIPEKANLTMPLQGLADMNAAPGVEGPRVVVGRNLAMIALAANWAARRRLAEIWLGATRDDRAAYKDCRPKWISMLSLVCWEATGIRVVAPFAEMTKREVVELGRDLFVPFDRTWSCYAPTLGKLAQHAPDGKPCGRCNGCREREAALE